MSKEALKLAQNMERLKPFVSGLGEAILRELTQDALALAQPEQEPVAVLRYQRGTTGRENEMPQVVSCNWLVDGDYQVFSEPPPQRKPLTDEREAFEAHRYTKYHAGSVSARSDGSYVHPHMQQAWEAWQARAAQE